MTKIYAVTAGSYSDYHIVGMYSTRENAEIAQKQAGNDIEEYTIDEHIDKMQQGLRVYYVKIAIDAADIIYILDWDYNDDQVDKAPELDADPREKRKSLIMLHWARGKDHAAKIAMEKRSVWLANNVSVPQS